MPLAKSIGRAARCLAVAASLSGGAAQAGPRPVEVQFLWVQGAEGDQAALDAFADCLFRHSNFEAFWGGQVQVTYGGSRVVLPPEAPLDEANAVAYVASLDLPQVGAEPVYVVLSQGKHLAFAECGLNTTGVVRGHPLGVALVRTDPPCWPGTEAMRNETQVTQHEVAEAIDQLLGHGGYSGDGACQGDGACPDACANFTGLNCPGAPSHSAPGCDGAPIDGWVVQRLSHAGRDSPPTDHCVACDFTLRYCPAGPGDPTCAPAQGCASSPGPGRLPALGLLLAAALLRGAWRRARRPVRFTG